MLGYKLSPDIKSVRDAAGWYLEELGARYDNIVVINADLISTTRTKGFIERYPGRAFNMGIAEQNMVSFAAGLAHEGFIPFVCSMAPFISMRACEQVRTDVCYAQLKVRFFGTGAGYSAGTAGATHCALEDVAIMGGMGGMAVVEPSSPVQAVGILEDSVTWNGPLYIRMGREAPPSDRPNEDEIKIGKAVVHTEGDDGAIIASGIVVHSALAAAKRIKDEIGASIRVVDMHTIKPIDAAAVTAAARTGRVIAAQDHNIVGGLGYYVAAVIAQAGISCKYRILGCPDKFVPLATTDYLYRVNEYDADGLYNNMKTLLEK